MVSLLVLALALQDADQPRPGDPQPDTPAPPVLTPVPPPVRVQTVPPPRPIRIPPPVMTIDYGDPDPHPRPVRAAGNPGLWQSPDDYPARALREEREGTVNMRITVGTDGRASACDVTGSSGSEDLDEAACRMIERRGRFDPATDSDGEAVEGIWNTAVQWVIPEDSGIPVIPLENRTLMVRAVVEWNGTVRECSARYLQDGEWQVDWEAQDNCLISEFEMPADAKPGQAFRVTMRQEQVVVEIDEDGQPVGDAE